MKTKKHEAWERFYSALGQPPEWLMKPTPFVVEALPLFKDYGAQAVLDLGCGMGRHCIYLAKKGFDVAGIDTSRSALKMAKSWSSIEGDANVAFLLASMTNLPFRSECFHAIVSVSVIHHAVRDDIDRTAEEICRVLRDNGIFLANLLSVEDYRYGSGQKIEERTFKVQDGPEKIHFEEIHRFLTREETSNLLASFKEMNIESIQSVKRDQLHCYWKVVAIK